MKRLRIMGAEEASTDEKTVKTSENQWKPVKTSETVIFGAKLAIADQNLNVYKLADSQNLFSALPIWCF